MFVVIRLKEQEGCSMQQVVDSVFFWNKDEKQKAAFISELFR